MEKWKFGIDNDKLVNLVIDGKKKATSSLYVGITPNINEKQIIQWNNNTDACVIRLTNYKILKFKNFTYEIIVKEGEDSSLEEWKTKHSSFFNDEINNFNDDTLILFEEFECIKVI